MVFYFETGRTNNKMDFILNGALSGPTTVQSPRQKKKITRQIKNERLGQSEFTKEATSARNISIFKILLFQRQNFTL